MFWKLHREKQLELLLFIYLVFLNESTVLWELFGTSFKNLTPSSDVSNSSLTHCSSCLFAFSKSVPYCWNSAVSFKETRFEASKTSCFCDRALLRITESVFQMLYSIYVFCWVPSFRNGLPESPYNMLLVDSGKHFFLAAGSVSFWSGNHLAWEEERYKGAARLSFSINMAETTIFFRENSKSYFSLSK